MGPYHGLHASRAAEQEQAWKAYDKRPYQKQRHQGKKSYAKRSHAPTTQREVLRQSPQGRAARVRRVEYSAMRQPPGPPHFVTLPASRCAPSLSEEIVALL